MFLNKKSIKAGEGHEMFENLQDEVEYMRSGYTVLL